MTEETYENAALILRRTKYYSGVFEREISEANGVTTEREINFIFAPDGLAAIYEKKNGTGNMYYVSTDNLGSINIIADAQGNIVNDLSYDAWGRRRNPYTWEQLTVAQTKALQPTLITDRGYTLHEHIDAFGLINMNGRAYDPLVGQFLSPDPFVQSSTSAQSYNRYSYCWNNPLKFVDPSGYANDLTWMDIQMRNYCWGESYTNFKGSWFNSYWLEDFLNKTVGDIFKTINATTATYNTYMLANCKEHESGAMVSTKNKDERTGVWAGYSWGGLHITTEIPVVTALNDIGELYGIYLEGDMMETQRVEEEIQSAFEQIRASYNSEYANPRNEPLIWGPKGEEFSYSSSWRNIGLWLSVGDRKLDYTKNGHKVPKVAKFIANMNPLVGFSSGVKGLISGKDIYNQNTTWYMSVFSILTAASTYATGPSLKGFIFENVVTTAFESQNE